MKLSDWTNASGIIPTHPTTETGAVSVIAPTVNMCQRTRAQLWTLDDYIVSSVSGPVVWLVPRASVLASREVESFRNALDTFAIRVREHTDAQEEGSAAHHWACDVYASCAELMDKLSGAK